MGESTCLMHPFSYASGISSETSQGNLMHALGQSISFGRFMSESLSWEKWSTFSHRSYVEEAERYAQPGSVAQKKAFFEAHYKSIAAKKAAALLEQANAANNRAETEFKGQDCDIGTTGSESTINYSQVPADEQLEVKGQSKEEVNRKSNKSIAELKELKIGEVKVSDSVLEENPTKNESLNRLEFPEMEKLLLEDVKSIEEASLPISEVKPEFSSLKSAVYQKAPKVLATTTKPPAPIYSWRENNVTPLTRKSTIDFAEKKRSTKKSLHELIYSTPARESETENNVTPLTRESTIDFVEEKRSTKKSLHELIYSTPARESDKSTTPAATPARESDKSTALAARKIESSRVAPSPYKASKDCKTPSTQMMASTEGNHPSETPCTGNRRSKTPLEPSAYGSNTTGPKWHILSAACSKSLSVCKNKLQSPASFIPFSLRTEERSTRRKQKLEDKFNAKEGQKVKLQTRLKEKAETELGKLRQSLCFKTRPLPDFYKERETGDQIKNEKTPRSLKLGRKKPSSSALQGIISPPPEEA